MQFVVGTICWWTLSFSLTTLQHRRATDELSWETTSRMEVAEYEDEERGQIIGVGGELTIMFEETIRQSS